MCRSEGCLRQSNAFGGVVAELIEAGQVRFHSILYYRPFDAGERAAQRADTHRMRGVALF
jgi:hypothetical protein